MNGGLLPQELQRDIHQNLCLRAGDENAGSHAEAPAVEIGRAQHVLEGDAAGPRGHVGLEAQAILRADRRRLRVELHRQAAQPLRQKLLGGPLRPVHLRLRQHLRGLLQQLQMIHGKTRSLGLMASG